MLQATYSNYQYTFYVSLLDKRIGNAKNNSISQYITADSYGYLWKFINDMSGEEQWSYGVEGVENDRYNSFKFFNDGTKNVYTGKLQLIPKGYYKYEIYEVANYNGCTSAGCDTFTASLGTAPDPTLTSGCKWELMPQGGAVTNTGTGDLIEENFSGLAADTYDVLTYQNDHPTNPTLLGASGFTVASKACGVDPDRYLLITDVDRQKDFMSVIISSIAPVGYKVTFFSVDSTNYLEHIITSNPETFTINLPAYTTFPHATGGDFSNGYGTYNVLLYNASNVLVDTYNQIFSVGKPFPSNHAIITLAINNVYDNTSCSQGVLTGNAFVATTTADSSGDGATYSGGARQFSKITEGKLYVDASAGNAQVQYEQHPDPSGTNYIWYGQ